MFRSNDANRVWAALAGGLAAVLLVLLAGCGGSPTAPRPPTPVCHQVVIPAVTRSALVCTATVCVVVTVEVEPARVETVCK